MAKALGDFAGEIDNARTKILELAAEIAASVVIGVGLAFFTAGLSAEAAAGTTAYIVEAAEALGIELAEQAAAIIARTVVMASMGSLESMATNTIVQLGRNIVFNENHNPFDGFNLDEVTTAGEFGFLVGGTIAGIQSLRGLSRAAADVKGASVPRGGGSTPLEGPPWSVAEGIPGSARGKSLNPPNARHTVSGAKSGMVKGENSVILRSNEQAVRDDVGQIATGNAKWNPQTQRYEINGRSYGVEQSGTVFPDSGAGIAKLDRNEYAALKEIAKVDGDLSKVPAFSKDPRFVHNPQAVAKAKAIYDGTYPE
ncbi:MAG: hypothetical protein ACRDRU_27050 [Pseudonocardiaceae bacterium]